MNRKEMYAIIKEHKWEEDIKSRAGRNYTNCPNDALQLHINLLTQKEKRESEKKNPVQIIDINVFNKVDKLIEILEKKHILLKSEIDYINK